MSLKDFIEMGGYAAYVWSAFGLTLAVLLGNAWLARRRFAAARLELARRLRAAGGTP